MTDSIDNLKSKIQQRGGLARPNRFLVELPPLAGVSTEEMNILCRSARLPGKQILTADRRIGMEFEKIAYGYAVEDVTMSFLMLKDYSIKKYFDAWRDSVMTIAVTLDDNNADVTAFRLDLIFDNDLFTWGHDSTHVEKGAYISGWTEGDSSENAHYSYEVVHYPNVGYTDSLDAGGSEISTSNNRYDWLRITMVSHNRQNKTDSC